MPNHNINKHRRISENNRPPATNQNKSTVRMTEVMMFSKINWQLKCNQAEGKITHWRSQKSTSLRKRERNVQKLHLIFFPSLVRSFFRSVVCYILKMPDVFLLYSLCTILEKSYFRSPAKFNADFYANSIEIAHRKHKYRLLHTFSSATCLFSNLKLVARERRRKIYVS
jgi:hypothetical protein